MNSSDRILDKISESLMVLDENPGHFCSLYFIHDSEFCASPSGACWDISQKTIQSC